MKKIVSEVKAFYPGYLAAHSDRNNRALHFAGATLFFILLGIALFTGLYWLIALAVLIGYLLPGIGHRFFQHNESFRASKPVLCVLCAFLLYLSMLSRPFLRRRTLRLPANSSGS